MAKSKREELPASADGVYDEVTKFFFGGDSVLTQEQLLARNVDFMRRCADGKLAAKESIRGGHWASSLPDEKRRELLSLIFTHNNWSLETDPNGTHGNGVVLFEGNYVIWTIREVDLTPQGMLMVHAPQEICLLVKHSSEI